MYLSYNQCFYIILCGNSLIPPACRECHIKMLVCFLIEQARQTLGLRFLELLFHRTDFLE